MYKVLAFDLDGTLAPSKTRMSDQMAVTLSQLLETYQLCVISGGKFGQFQLQVLDALKVGDSELSKLHLMPACGTQYYRYENGWQEVYAENFTEDQKRQVYEALEQGIEATGLHEATTYGPIIEDRGSQITFSALGQDIASELGEEGIRLKEEWDADGTKKERLRAYLATLIPEFEIRAGGTTSIDITKPGIDKAYGIGKLIEMLGIAKDEVLFFGDKMQPGGNDYPVKAYGVDSREVLSPEDTLTMLKNLQK